MPALLLFTSNGQNNPIVFYDEVTQRAATFDIQELVIVDHVLTAAQAASIAKYFWLEWHG